jgi:hypothetical protein
MENLALTGIQIPDRPACSESLYLPRYPGHKIPEVHHENSVSRSRYKFRERIYFQTTLGRRICTAISNSDSVGAVSVAVHKILTAKSTSEHPQVHSDFS